MSLSLATATQAAGASDNTLRIGRVISSDETTGVVKVQVSGVIFEARHLNAALRPAPGYIVALLRQEASWLILGVVSGRGDLAALSTPWTIMPSVSWISLTGAFPAIANGTIVGRYRQAHPYTQRYEFQVYLVGGSTTNWGSGIYAWELPFPATTASGLHEAGAAHVLNAAVQEYAATCRVVGTTSVRIFWAGLGGGGSVANTSPFTFGTSDEIRFSIFFDRDMG